MEYTIQAIRHRAENKDGEALMSKQRTDKNGEIIPPKPYMIVNMLLDLGEQEEWVTTFDYDGHTADWEAGTKIEGIVKENGEYEGKTQYIFNRLNKENKEENDETIKRFLQRLENDNVSIASPTKKKPAVKKEEVEDVFPE